MTAYDNSSHLRTVNSPAPPFWVCLVLGIVMVLAGIMVLSDIMFFTVISALFIGWMSVAAGAFEIFHAFWIKWWGGFVWQVLLGILYIAFGFVLVSQPLVGSLMITYLLGLGLAGAYAGWGWDDPCLRWRQVWTGWGWRMAPVNVCW